MQKHLRNTFLAGILGAVPLAVTAFVIWWIDNRTRAISIWLFGREIPFAGVLIAVIAIYLIGLVATSLIGQSLLRLIDRLLSRIPILREVYAAWKHISLTPGGTEGTFSKVVLIPDATGNLLLGFTSGRPVDSAGQTLCVFVPNIPNPVTGRLYFVRFDQCRFVDISTEEAFKVILSTGNYVPEQIGHAAA
ncbi:MAG TPA: DUF502 domain-containing protein [Tepidisphaeraceae bacterium]|jgi:uncharacterized membrane protein